MTAYNNYDQSSTGIDVELTIFYNRDQAYNELEDFIQDSQVLTLRDRRGRLDYIALAPDLGEKQWTVSALESMSESELIELVQLVVFDTGYYFTKQEMVKELRHVTKAEYLKAVHTHTSYRDLPYTYTVNGYSQGDACRVYDMYPQGKSPYDREYIHHLLWDTPIYGMLQVNGEEYYIDEYLEDMYEYNPEALLRNLAERTELSPEALQEIAAILPTHLEYL